MLGRREPIPVITTGLNLFFSSGGNQVIVPSVASLTLSGQVASLKTSRIVVAATGVFTETGVAATLKQGKVLTAATGSFSLTGQSVGLKTTRTLPITTATYALSGKAANLLFGHKNVETVGTFNLSGKAANLLYSKTPLAAGVGSYTWTGVANSLRRTRILQALTVSYNHLRQKFPLQEVALVGVEVQSAVRNTTILLAPSLGS